MKIAKLVAYILVIVGAVNWGLVGAFSFDVVTEIFGPGTLARIIYILVGLSGLFMLYYHHILKKK